MFHVKHFASLLLALVLTLSPALAAEGPTTFSDVPTDAWYAPYVEVCTEAGLMEGMGDGCFSPDTPLTLAETIVLSARLHHILRGGDGVLPPLPEDPEDYFGLWNSQGERILGILDVKEFPWPQEHNVLCITLKEPIEEDTLHLRVGFPGDTIYLDADGTFETENTETGTQGHYAFPLPKGMNGDQLRTVLTGYLFSRWDSTWVETHWNEWYFPSTFYLIYREGLVGCVTPRAETRVPLTSDDHALREELMLTLWDVCDDCDELGWSIGVHLPPDVPGERYSADQAKRIMDFYRANILTGTDNAGTFDGEKTLTRAETAAILARVLEPELRLHPAVEPRWAEELSALTVSHLAFGRVDTEYTLDFAAHTATKWTSGYFQGANAPDQVETVELDPGAVAVFQQSQGMDALLGWSGMYIDPNVMDGHQWAMTLAFSDGTQRDLAGSNSYPQGWDELYGDLLALTGWPVLDVYSDWIEQF